MAILTTGNISQSLTTISPPNQTHVETGQNSIVTIYIAVYLCALVFIVFGNCGVIITISRVRELRTAANTFLIGLAFADLAVGLFVVPFQLSALGLYVENLPLLCKLCIYTAEVAHTSSILFVVAIAASRYYHIIYPMRRKINRQEAVICVILLWLFACLYCVWVPFAYGIDFALVTHPDNTTSQYWGCIIARSGISLAKTFIRISFVLLYILPCVVVVGSSLSMIKRLMNLVQPGENIEGTRKKPNKGHRSIRLLMLVTIVFAVGHGPNYILQLYFTSGLIITPDTSLLFRAFEIMATCVSWINPIIYASVNYKLRGHFIRPFKRFCRKGTSHGGEDSSFGGRTLTVG